MDDLLKVLNGAASAAGEFFAGQNSRQQANALQLQQAQQQLYAQGAAERQAQLAATSQQAAYRYIAIGGIALIALVLLMRSKKV